MSSRLLAADATLARASGTEIMEAITELSRYLTGTELQGMRVTDQIGWQLPDDRDTGAPGWSYGLDAAAPAAGVTVTPAMPCISFETQEIEHDTDVAVLATFQDGRTYGIGTIQRPTSPSEFCSRVQALWREVRHQWPEAVG